MAMLPCKRILLVVILVLLCCFSKMAIGARTLGVAQIKSDTHNQKAINDDLEVHDEEHFSSTDDLGAMDYTPASKKPPIHN